MVGQASFVSEELLLFFFCAALVAKSPPGISFAQWNSFMAVPRAPVEEP